MGFPRGEFTAFVLLFNENSDERPCVGNQHQLKKPRL